MKNTLIFFFLLGSLAACSWVTYDDNGRTRVRPKYPVGSSVIYEDGTYARDHRYNQYRPQAHVLEPGARVQ